MSDKEKEIQKVWIRSQNRTIKDKMVHCDEEGKEILRITDNGEIYIYQQFVIKNNQKANRILKEAQKHIKLSV